MQVRARLDMRAEESQRLKKQLLEDVKVKGVWGCPQLCTAVMGACMGARMGACMGARNLA